MWYVRILSNLEFLKADDFSPKVMYTSLHDLLATASQLSSMNIHTYLLLTLGADGHVPAGPLVVLHGRG